LAHPSSLPGPFGIGDLGPEAERFLDWAQSAGQRLWQVLPLAPTGPSGSPYSGLSAFAGNPLLISPERLVEEGFLSLLDVVPPALRDERVAFAEAAALKERLLRASWEYFSKRAAPRELGALSDFRASPDQGWLADWALYAAARGRAKGLPWTKWDRGLARREAAALDSARRELREEIAFHEYVQFLFFRQWDRIREEARRRRILILGDIPIYLAADSADVWANQDLFALDSEGLPEAVAGVPPDYFSPSGQLWGYPLYRWERMEKEGFSWWVRRIEANLRLFDFVRLDHFRGFVAYWSVPASETTAESGEWLPGPGRPFFRAVSDALGELPAVAEDLGTITPDVRALASELGYPGMKVLQFAFSEPDHPFLPRHHPANAVVYTGTHDNDTARGWFEKAPAGERERTLAYLGTDGSEIEWDLIRAAYESVAGTAVVPLQDVLGLGSEARMNTPGTRYGNWEWRARRSQFRPDLASRLRKLAERTGRMAPVNSQFEIRNSKFP
jgi:4-alpha-glucanotransferase